MYYELCVVHLNGNHYGGLQCVVVNIFFLFQPVFIEQTCKIKKNQGHSNNIIFKGITIFGKTYL